MRAIVSGSFGGIMIQWQQRLNLKIGSFLPSLHETSPLSPPKRQQPEVPPFLSVRICYVHEGADGSKNLGSGGTVERFVPRVRRDEIWGGDK